MPISKGGIKFIVTLVVNKRLINKVKYNAYNTINTIIVALDKLIIYFCKVIKEYF